MEKKPSSILTSTGIWFDVLNPISSLIDLQDIASALSKLCRFGGHYRQFYSVAEHSILASEMVRKRYGNNIELMRWALLHDASEAYVVDIPRPAKRQLAEYVKIEDAIQRAVA
jgi:5'-deoxynucleotidase YfbR-like HD superfamily hydrolase